MLSILMIVSLIFLVGFAVLSVKTYNLAHPFSILLIFSIPYYLAPALDIVIFDNSNNYSISKTFLHLTVFFLFSLVIYFFQGKAIKGTVNNYVLRARFSSTIDLVIVTLVFSAYGIYQLNLVMEYGNNRADIYANKSVFYDLFRMLIIAFLIVFQLREKINKRKLDKLTLLLIAIFIFSEVFIVGDRRLALILIVLSFFIWREKIRINFKLILFLVTLILTFFAVGLTRSGSSNINYLILLNISNMEFGASQRIFDYCISTLNCGELKSTLFNLPSQMLPEVINPERGLSAEKTFAKIYNYKYYQSGGTYAYSFFVELILNVGYFGLFVASIMFSSIYYIYNKIRDELSKDLVGIFIIIFMLFLPRMSLLAMSKQLLVYIVFIVAVILLMNRLYVRR